MGKNKTAQALVALAFSLFIGGMFIFLVISVLDLAFPAPAGDSYSYSSGGTRYLALSLTALIVATITLFGSLRIPYSLAVIGDGLLLGGIFTTLYSVTQVMGYGEENNVVRMLITLAALALALVVGWLKFTKGKEVQEALVPSSSSEMEERLRQVEETLESVRTAFHK